MTTRISFVRRHPLVCYYLLTFAISWGGVVAVVGTRGFPGTPESFSRLIPFAVLAMLAGPSVSGILLTVLTDGWAGLRALGSRMTAWRVGLRWYAAALLTAPLLMFAILLPLSSAIPELLPAILVTADKAGALRLSLAIALGAGILEEIGWTGFVTPRLLERRGVVATGLIVGVLWGVWHWIVALWSSGASSNPLALVSYLVDSQLYLAVFRVLMVWVYERTGSLLVVMLMHASLTASARLVSPVGMAGLPLIAFDLVWATAIALIVAVVVAAPGRHVPRSPIPGRAG